MADRKAIRPKSLIASVEFFVISIRVELGFRYGWPPTFFLTKKSVLLNTKGTMFPCVLIQP
eukprot:UN11682